MVPHTTTDSPHLRNRYQCFMGIPSGSDHPNARFLAPRRISVKEWTYNTVLVFGFVIF